MKKTLLATVFAAAMLPIAASSASAAPNAYTNPFVRTYALACKIDSYSVEKSTNFILVRNTAPRAIPQGAKIELRIFVRYRFVTRIETAYAQVTPGTGTITFTQPYGARFCTAKVTLRTPIVVTR